MGLKQTTFLHGSKFSFFLRVKRSQESPIPISYQDLLIYVYVQMNHLDGPLNHKKTIFP